MVASSSNDGYSRSGSSGWSGLPHVSCWNFLKNQAVVETVLVVLVRGSSGNDGSSDDDKSRLFYVLLGASISVLSTELFPSSQSLISCPVPTPHIALFPFSAWPGNKLRT